MSFSESMISDTMRPISGSAIRAIFHLLGKPGMISFAGGNPATSALEPDVISELAARALLQNGASLLQYGATEGFAPLRESVAEFVKSCGVIASADCVLPTQGSQQALDLMVKSLVNPGDCVLVESPTFLGALQTFSTYGAKLCALPSDAEGVIPEAAEAMIRDCRPKMMYIIPTFQNPSGKTLGLQRRKALCELAAKYEVVLAEDDPYRDLRYEGEALPAIASFDDSGYVVYLGSFSKLISPGLRVGYAVVKNPVLLRKMTIGKQSVDVHSPILNQAIVDLYLREGRMEAHLLRVGKSYKAQLSAMLRKLEGFPEGVTFTRPEGGLFVWAELPAKIDAEAMLPEATNRSVAYVPGTHFFFDGGRKNTLRLNFSNSELPAIDRGMDILSGLIKEKM